MRRSDKQLEHKEPPTMQPLVHKEHLMMQPLGQEKQNKGVEI
jgi:hypothetical protein